MARESSYRKIDDIIEATSPYTVAAHFGVDLPQRESGELRTECVFNADCQLSSYGNLAINLDRTENPIYCHSCGIRGNLLTLLWGMWKRQPPNGGRLRGEEFREARDKLLEIVGEAVSTGPNSERTPLPRSRSAETPAANDHPATPAARNVPLRMSDKEGARKLVDLDADFVTEVDRMTPAAAAYFRRRPFLSPEVCEKWRMGYLPRDGRSLLRGYVVYGMLDQRGDVLSWFGRDVNFDEKLRKWESSGRDPKKRPSKHRFVSGFHRGLELYGQQASRMDEPHVQESLERIGLVVVEGPNDVIRMDTLGVAAVGLCSNRATEEQVAKIIGFAQQVAGGRVVLLPDNDEQGEDGAKELLWQLHQREGITPRLGWSRATSGGTFAGRQPESLTDDEWTGTLLRSLLQE